MAIVREALTTTSSGDGYHTANSGAIATNGVSNPLLIAAVSYYGGNSQINFATEVVDKISGVATSNVWNWLTQAWVNAGGSTYDAIRIGWCIPTQVGASHTLNVNAASVVYPGCRMVLYSGVHASPYVSEATASYNNRATTRQPGSLTPTEDNCLLVSAIVGNAAPSSIDSSFNLVHSIDTWPGLADQIQTSATARNPTWTAAGSNLGSVVMAAFKAAASAGNTRSITEYLKQGSF